MLSLWCFVLLELDRIVLYLKELHEDSSECFLLCSTEKKAHGFGTAPELKESSRFNTS